MISPELQKAMDCLHLNDVYLRSLVAHCENGFEPKYDSFETLVFQTRHFVKESSIVEIDRDKRVLRVLIALGARWVVEESGVGGGEVRAYVEADYVAEYSMTETLPQESIDAFSLTNASCHVWPYWRELLNSQCTRMHFPRVVLDTVQLARNRHVNSQVS